MFYRFANPNQFMKLANAIQPWVARFTGVFFVFGLYFSLINSPPDYQQGDTVRIMYVHVPSAWMALFCYCSMSISAAVGLIWRHPLAHICAKSIAPIGAIFTLLALLTGAIWGKPMWGTWWVWDARLTSMLILLFLYIGFIALDSAFDNKVRGTQAASILAMIGLINVPIIKFSVDWWNTLHQPASVIKMGGPAIHTSMLIPLFLMFLAFTSFFLWILLIRIRGEINHKKIDALMVRQSMNGLVEETSLNGKRGS